jgi:hypothetical protein
VMITFFIIIILVVVFAFDLASLLRRYLLRSTTDQSPNTLIVPGALDFPDLAIGHTPILVKDDFAIEAHGHMFPLCALLKSKLAPLDGWGYRMSTTTKIQVCQHTQPNS